MSRSAHITRTTGETDIDLTLDLDGDGAGSRDTGVGFFDHMLDAVARHGALDLDVKVDGDLQTGPHHTIEDTGIVLGRALDEALGDRAGIRRYGSAVVPMDEARASCALDVSGRTFLVFEADLPAEAVADFDSDLLEEFLRAVAGAAKLTVHVNIERGSNTHHMVEAAFKAFARALREAVSIDPEQTGDPVDQGPAVIAILDYGMGNLRSVEKAFAHVGVEAVRTRDHDVVRAASGVALPGVGAMPRAMELVRSLEFDELVRERAAAGVPVIGICMGMQLLFESTSEHGGADGNRPARGQRGGAGRPRADHPAHRLEPGVVAPQVGADGGPVRSVRLLPRALVRGPPRPRRGPARHRHIRRRVRLGGGARQRLRRAVPSREVRA